MDRHPAASMYPYNIKRRGSTPSLIQYATINAQLQKERSSPSLDITDNAESDEEPNYSEEELNSDQRSMSHPALNILHVTNVRGRVNILSLPPSRASPRHSSASRASKSHASFRKSKKKDDKLKCVEQPVCNVIKRSSSHGVLANDGSASSQIAANPNNRRNSWCHASGTSAVAIDNKIEQAMDLVKSHLMFAVREEVEVLKEKIAELMERINQLEVENSFLRSQASPETLAQLAAQSNSTSPPAGPVS